MQYFPAKEDAIARMKRRGTKSVRWSLVDRRIEYSIIKAGNARNWDGSPAGDDQNPKREILQLMVWRKGGDPRYTNWW